MATIPFDVNDAELRSIFLRDTLPKTVVALRDDTPPRWGHMTAQQMIEHLAWSYEISTGRVRVECPVPEGQLERMKRFLYSNKPAPREFMNPALTAGLPPLRYAGLAESKAALEREIERFLQYSTAVPAAVHTHPVFGPIGVEEWSRTHYKHGHHHLLHFGLIEGELPPERHPS